MVNEIPPHIRSGQHKHDLIQNRHGNPILQAAFNKYGEDSFVFQLVEAVLDSKSIIEIEQRYLDLHCDGQVTCYNIAFVAGSSLGVKRSIESIEKRKKSMVGKWGRRKGIPHPEYAKILMRDTHFGLQNNLGTVYSEETKNKISAAKKGVSIHRKKYCVTFIDPLGIVHPDIRDVKNFARAHGLHCDGLYKLVNGKYEVYHGWKTSSVVVL